MNDRHDRPADEELQGRRILERILPEIIKRVVETGVEKLQDGPESLRQMVGDMKLPKEMVALLFAQIDETKNGLYRVVAKEIRDFLEHTNMADELTHALTKLSFEIKTEIRFIPNDAGAGADKLPKPEVRSSVHVKGEREHKDRERRSEKPPRPDEE